MSYSAALKHLGFDSRDRVVLFNADDFGLCESSISAVDELANVGVLSSASLMPPCPWFPAAAQWSVENPEFSVGVHLTLNSEWSTYRWRPNSAVSAISGLRDELGYLHQERNSVVDLAHPECVNFEIETQIQLALTAGVNVTHIDAHMYTAMRWPFLQHYLAQSNRFDIPAVLWNLEQRPHFGYDGVELQLATELINRKVSLGEACLFDLQLWTRMAPPVATLESVKSQLSKLPAGLTRFYIHPAKDSPELRAIVPDWQCRVADFDVFSNPALKRFIQEQGIQIVSSKQIQTALKQCVM